MFCVGICCGNKRLNADLKKYLTKWSVKMKISMQIEEVKEKDFTERTAEYWEKMNCLFWEKGEINIKEDNRINQTAIIEIVTKKEKDNKNRIASAEYQKEEIYELIKAAYCRYLSDEKSYVIYKRPQYIKTELKNIIYFYSDRRKIGMCCVDGTYEFYQKMDHVEEELTQKEKKFIRMHQSYLVNPNYIKKISKREVFLINGDILTVSQKRRHNLKEFSKVSF